MEKMFIKDYTLHIGDKQKDYVIDMDLIDIVCTESFTINLKFDNGQQAYLHLEDVKSKEEFNQLAEKLCKFANFYRISDCVIINLENLCEADLDEQPTESGYYSLDLKFKRMRGGVASKNLEGQKRTLEEIVEAKRNYDEIVGNRV